MAWLLNKCSGRCCFLLLLLLCLFRFRVQMIWWVCCLQSLPGSTWNVSERRELELEKVVAREGGLCWTNNTQKRLCNNTMEVQWVKRRTWLINHLQNRKDQTLWWRDTLINYYVLKVAMYHTIHLVTQSSVRHKQHQVLAAFHRILILLIIAKVNR